MASYNTVITNEGAALLASVIANQGTLTFSEMRFSTTDYDGVEQTLTVGTFAGTFITAAAAASVVDSTTIKVGSQFDNSGIVGDHPLYSIGIVGTDGNTTALIAVCTTTNPDIIRAALTGVSTYAFNVNLAVSSTSNITVAGTTAAVLYDTDVVDNLTSTATNKPLSANQGRLIGDNLAANENVYGAKNICDLERYLNKCNVAFTKSGNAYSFTMNSTFYTSIFTLLSHDTALTVTATSITGDCYTTLMDENDTPVYEIAPGSNINVTQTFSKIKFAPALDITTVTITGLMICDARVIDPTFAPFAKTNLQLTNDKAERADLATLKLTGSTNTTGSTINEGVYFYLNGSYCKAKTSIANGATFTLNTNYEEVTVGGELNTINTILTAVDIPVSNDSVSPGSFTIIGLVGIVPSKMLSAMYINNNTGYHDWLLATFKVESGSLFLTIRNTHATETATIGGTIRVITK